MYSLFYKKLFFKTNTWKKKKEKSTMTEQIKICNYK